MRSCFIALAVLAVLVSGTAMANPNPFSPGSKDVVLPDPGTPVDSPDCVTEGYKSYTYTDGRAIPDNTANGLVSGPLTITDTENVVDLVVDLSIAHTWTGDLTVNLYHDVACDGWQNDTPISLLCRPDLVGCPGPGSCCGCSDDLVGSGYSFSSDGLATIAEPCGGTGVVAAGCYREAVETTAFLRDVTSKEGCWYVVCGDGAGADTGTLFSWTLWFNNEGGTATETATWGSVKTLYNE
jgi:hypothetical protein